MKIAVLTRYGPKGANSRYRLLQYIPLLERAGHAVEVRAMLDDGYLDALYATGRRSRWHLMRAYLRRFAQLRGLAHFDAVLCDQEFLPYFPPAVERWSAGLCTRLVVDYDDAAYCKYNHLPWLRQRIPELMARAEAVVAGNRQLFTYATRHSRNVHLIPTVVDVARYSPRQDGVRPEDSSGQGVRLVWIGTPVTAPFLRELAPVLTALKTRHPGLGLRLIGAGAAILSWLPFAEVVEWTAESEARLLAECDIGLMPLPDNEFTRAKCGLKLIQCMAAGLPVVASPVGANCEIVGAGEDGYLADAPREWFECLDRLILSAELRRRLGRNAAAKVRRCYSLEQGFAAWMRLLEPREQKQTIQPAPAAGTTGASTAPPTAGKERR